MAASDAIVGISDHGGWAVMVTATADGTLLDRRRVSLVDDDLPKIPHHSEGQALPLNEAVRLVERVDASAKQHAALTLEALATKLPGLVRGIALRQCPALPATVAERISDHRARNVADWAMYRQALAGAAEARGWLVHWYNAKDVFSAANAALGCDDHLINLRKAIGPPWSKDYQIAMASAVIVARAKGR
jgi:hypothetical protein